MAGSIEAVNTFSKDGITVQETRNSETARKNSCKLNKIENRKNICMAPDVKRRRSLFENEPNTKYLLSLVQELRLKRCYR